MTLQQYEPLKYDINPYNAFSSPDVSEDDRNDDKDSVDDGINMGKSSKNTTGSYLKKILIQ